MEIYELRDIIKHDPDIQKLITDSNVLIINHKPTRSCKDRGKSKAYTAMTYFWVNITGAQLRLILSEKYNVKASRGKIKDALVLNFKDLVC